MSDIQKRVNDLEQRITVLEKWRDAWLEEINDFNNKRGRYAVE